MAPKKKKKKQGDDRNIVAQNRKARHDYALEEFFEAGIALLGTEVKSLRSGKASITESYAAINDDREVVLYNSNIPEYNKASNIFNHEPKRPRKLLLHRNQINKLIGKLEAKGYTLVPLSIYFNKKGVAKVELALGKGKTVYDKRESIKKRDWQRQKSRMLRED